MEQQRKKVNRHKRTLIKKPDKRIFENGNAISLAVRQWLDIHKGIGSPTYNELAKMTGLHSNTIKKYYHDLHFEPIKMPQVTLVPDVINNLFKNSSKNVSAAVIFLKLMGLNVDDINVNIKTEYIVKRPRANSNEEEAN